VNIPDVEEKHQISMAGVTEDPKDNVNCVSDGKTKYTEAFQLRCWTNFESSFLRRARISPQMGLQPKDPNEVAQNSAFSKN